MKDKWEEITDLLFKIVAELPPCKKCGKSALDHRLSDASCVRRDN